MHDSDQLSLRVPHLVVQPAKGALSGAAVVVLHEKTSNEPSVAPQALLMPALEKKAALVAVDNRFGSTRRTSGNIA